jgi:drug/metabolite transporter (DMT)-like permease
MLLSTMLVFVKLSSEAGVALPEIMFWRQFSAMPVILAWVASHGALASLRTERFGRHLTRSAMGLVGMVFTFGSATLLPLAESTTIGFTVPMFATMLSAWLLKEQVGRHRWAAVLVGFVGVLIVVQPGQSPIPLKGAVVGLTSAIMIAFISLQLRDLTRTEAPATVVFWFSCLSSIPLGLALPFVITPHSAHVWGLLLCTGLFGALGQIALTSSLRYAPVSVVVGMDYASLIWSTLYGWLIWDHLPPASTWAGAPVIIASGLYIAWREHQRAIVRTPEIAA